ncbi:transaldolase [Acidisphaera sp. L21]|uniref:transaldolase n=1 Tax=Acidisphaera sp. L21 TaxID=1641851 RepID=UPI0020B111BF|nr:transaldolase [Acidisphaera sp. L21]
MGRSRRLRHPAAPLRPNRRARCRVSIEVDPRISGDADRTAAEARGLWWLVDRPNLFIKIPATLEGLPAITTSLADGISVNVTLIFSLDRHRAVLDAFLTGLEQRKAAGGSLIGVESVASFFISRVDTEVDRQLIQLTTQNTAADRATELGGLRGQAALANARLAYQVYEQMLTSDRWKALADVGGRPQRLLWASTGVKDKVFSATRYVTELVAPDTVNTMPEATLNAVATYGEIRGNPVLESYRAARGIVETLYKVGVSMEEVAITLERQGIASFAQSWDELIESVTRQVEKAGAVVMPAGAVRPAIGQSGESGSPPAGAPSLATQKAASPQSREIYRSSNGDRWQLIIEPGSGRKLVRHTANTSSGGKVTDTELAEFLSLNGSGPELTELRRMIADDPLRADRW